MKAEKSFGNTIHDSRFPPSLFFVYLIVLFFMSGVHIGLIIGMNSYGWNELAQTIIPILYWAAVAAGLTLFTRRQVRKTYEEPMHRLAGAAKKVSEGDFSVYIAPMHTLEKMDYLDKMMIDFNKMVEELGSIETLKTDFFSNVSHEIKAPISVIQNNAELLCREELTEKQKECADTIFRATRSLSDLIGNILKLNKLEKQTIMPMVENYDLCGQLAECALNFEPAWEEKRLQFEADLEDHAEISADPSLMELVWNNLFSNAVKFTEPGGTILLKEWAEPDAIKVAVQDTGCGMTEETRKHIFEKFYQGDTSHSMAGNGLGLALVMRVLQLNGFQIEVASEPGKGSRFTVIIPRKGKEADPEDE